MPPSWGCVHDKHVCHEVGDSSANDGIQMEIVMLQRVNTMTCDLLMSWGFQGVLGILGSMGVFRFFKGRA